AYTWSVRWTNLSGNGIRNAPTANKYALDTRKMSCASRVRYASDLSPLSSSDRLLNPPPLVYA
ncbi:MAG: hypothetical protein ACREBQ_11195, partial [Nitrososphaerales archaeon]